MGTEQRRWLTAKEVAERYPIGKRTLDNWRSQGIGPTFYKRGRGRVAYDQADVEKFFREGRCEPSVRAALKESRHVNS